MTTKSENPEPMTQAAQPENPEPMPQFAQTDWFLQMLVQLANTSPMEIGITLQVSGMLVSGSIVSRKSYFEGFAEDFASPFSGEPNTAETMKKNFSMFGEKKLDENEQLPQFVHLKSARFFNTIGNPIPKNRGVWWRGRICEVGGFSLGILSAE